MRANDDPGGSGWHNLSADPKYQVSLSYFYLHPLGNLRASNGLHIDFRLSLCCITKSGYIPIFHEITKTSPFFERPSESPSNSVADVPNKGIFQGIFQGSDNFTYSMQTDHRDTYTLTPFSIINLTSSHSPRDHERNVYT